LLRTCIICNFSFSICLWLKAEFSFVYLDVLIGDGEKLHRSQLEWNLHPTFLNQIFIIKAYFPLCLSLSLWFLAFLSSLFLQAQQNGQEMAPFLINTTVFIMIKFAVWGLLYSNGLLIIALIDILKDIKSIIMSCWWPHFHIFWSKQIHIPS